MNLKEQILAALKTLGASSPRALADHLKVEPGKLSYHLRALLAEKSIQASGTTAGRLYALPGQKMDGAAPPSGKKRKKKAKGKRRKTAGRTARAPATAPAAEGATGFLAAFTADSRMVVLDGAAPPQIFAADKTNAIADLILTHFKA